MNSLHVLLLRLRKRYIGICIIKQIIHKTAELSIITKQI